MSYDNTKLRLQVVEAVLLQSFDELDIGAVGAILLSDKLLEGT